MAAVETLYGISSMLLGTPGANGEMALTLTELFGKSLATGSVSISTTEPTVSNVGIEETDDPILSIQTPGVMNLNFGTYNTSPEVLRDTFGGTITNSGTTAATRVWNAPAATVERTMSVRIETKNGRWVEMPTVQLAPRLNMAFDKTTPARIDFVGTVLAPANGGSKIRMGFIV